MDQPCIKCAKGQEMIRVIKGFYLKAQLRHLLGLHFGQDLYWTPLNFFMIVTCTLFPSKEQILHHTLSPVIYGTQILEK
jgi:hypothetical protein